MLGKAQAISRQDEEHSNYDGDQQDLEERHALRRLGGDELRLHPERFGDTVAEIDVESFGPGRYVVSGTMHLTDAETKLGLELPEGEYETIAGFLMDRLGRIPKRRDTVEHDGWRLRVLSMHRRRVVQVLAEQTPATRD